MTGSGTIADVGDGVLVGRAQSGDGEAYAELYRRHYPSVVRACTRRLGQRVEAEEVAQAAFVRGWERIHLCAGEQRFGAWMQVIARRLCADAARARARSLPWELTVTTTAGGSPEEYALQTERIEALRSILERLPRRQREVLVARDVEGRRPTEIAAALGVSLGAVDSLLLRARRAAADGYRTMVAEQGVATVASGAMAAAATGGLVGGPEGVWRSLARGVQAVRSALLHLGGVADRAPAILGSVAGVATLAVVGVAPAPESPPPRHRAPVVVPAPQGLATPVPDQGLAAPLPATPAVPPAPAAPPVPSQRQLQPARPNPVGEALALFDVEAAADTVVVPGAVESPSSAVPARPGRAAWQAGREAGRAAWSWGAEEGRQTGRELRELRRQTRPG